MPGYDDSNINVQIKLLGEDVEPIVIHTTTFPEGYPTQKTVLGCVSSKLAEQCNQKNNYLTVDDNIFRIFLGWLLHRRIDVHYKQPELAMAWAFRHQYEISAFQDALMRELVAQASRWKVSAYALRVKYDGEHENLPQSALITQLAIDMHTSRNKRWYREYFALAGIRQVDGFMEDLIEAMAIVRHVADSPTPELDMQHFLVSMARA